MFRGELREDRKNLESSGLFENFSCIDEALWRCIEFILAFLAAKREPFTVIRTGGERLIGIHNLTADRISCHGI